MPIQLDTHCHRHAGLRTKFRGVVLRKEGIDVVQYRGLQYGSIQERFARPELVTPVSDGEIDGTQFGTSPDYPRPECPQIRHDIKQLFCIPSSYPDEMFEQDEFRCLNLTITTPMKLQTRAIPVMIWIHGGSHISSVEGPASRMSDTGRLVADSVNHGLPIIIVALNYRLNIFGLGDRNGDRNLALKDQSCAVEWVCRYISGFGGDPTNITLAGESAGAICIHAHSILGTPAKRVILQSGTLYTIPPVSLHRRNAFLDRFESVVQSKSGKSARYASVEVLLEALVELKVSSMWLDLTAELEDWQTRPENVEELMIGDCEFESILWLDIIRRTEPQNIIKCFDDLPEDEAAQILAVYGIDARSPQACRRGALNLIGDYKFAQPPVKLATRWRNEGKSVYQYVVDEVNPFRQSLGSHHGVDILYLFGNYDLSKTPDLERTGREMRKKWILFVNGQKPWDGSLYAFGPQGACNVLDENSLSNRRRWDNLKQIDDMRPKLDSVVDKLTQGRFRTRKSRI